MIKKYVLILIFIVIAALPSFADDNYLHMIGGLGAGYYYLYPKDIQIQGFYKGGITYRGFLEFISESGISASGDISYFSQGNMSSIAPYGTNLTIIPITASAAYHPLKKSSISPYFGAGIGIYNINESDPDVVYVRETKFGKHIFVGADFYIDRSTILRAELRQTFIDPLNSPLYYQASLGGLTASVNLAIEWPIGGKTAISSEPAPPVQQNSFAYNERSAMIYRMNEINSYYDEQNWNRMMYYQPWNPPLVYINTYIPPSQQQIDAQNAANQQYKMEQEQKRHEYILQKRELRQEKKEMVNPKR